MESVRLFLFAKEDNYNKTAFNVVINKYFQMSDEDDEEVEMMMNRKSRFSRYRTRARETVNFDATEAILEDEHNSAP
jgi:hypothetical protein